LSFLTSCGEDHWRSASSPKHNPILLVGVGPLDADHRQQYGLELSWMCFWKRERLGFPFCPFYLAFLSLSFLNICGRICRNHGSRGKILLLA
jgi:hypothetical protein